jgi:DNA-binding FadR family transcriptional regulator
MATRKIALHKKLASDLLVKLANGKYAVGDRLPSARKLAAQYQVSRPTVRGMIVALEVRGLIEVRAGARAYIRRPPAAQGSRGANVTAFELTEARLAIEGEAVALAAVLVSAAELGELDTLVTRVADEIRRDRSIERLDRTYHLLIARATQNVAIIKAIERLWQLPTSSPASVSRSATARRGRVMGVVERYGAVARALRARDSVAARAAMRALLMAGYEAS